MKKLYPLSALAIACAAIPVAAATTAPNKLEEIIVVSSRVAMPLRQIGTSVSVIDSQEIQQRGFHSLFEILRSQPAIAVSSNGGPGKTTALRIRGEEGFRTLMLIDGIEMSDASGTQIGPNFEHLMSSGIHSVEILRGPQGLMYGADAGGVVNITTRAPEEGFAGTVSAEAGRYDTQQLAADIGGGNSTVDFSLASSDFKTNGSNARTTDNLLRDDDGYENTATHGRIGWNVSDALRLQLAGREAKGDNEYDGFSPESDHHLANRYEQAAWRLSADYEHGSFTHQASYNENSTDRDNYTAGVLGFFTRGGLERWSYIGSFTSSPALKLVYGADLKTESIRTEDGAARDQNGYYLEYQGGFNSNLFVTTGLRFDDNEDFGSHTSYRISAAYLLDVSNGELKLKGAYGTGFRAPSLSEIALNKGPFSPSSASLIELKAEKSNGYDIGLSWYSAEGILLEAMYFDQTITHEIAFESVGNLGYYLQGSGDSQSKGIELLGEFPLGDRLALQSNYTYNDTEDSDGDVRIRRPKHLLNVGMNWKTFSDRLVLGLNLRGSYDAVDFGGKNLDNYEVVDINAQFEITEGLSVYGRVENLLDEDYEEISTYNTRGAAAYAGVRYSF